MKYPSLNAAIDPQSKFYVHNQTYLLNSLIGGLENSNRHWQIIKIFDDCELSDAEHALALLKYQRLIEKKTLPSRLYYEQTYGRGTYYLLQEVGSNDIEEQQVLLSRLLTLLTIPNNVKSQEHDNGENLELDWSIMFGDDSDEAVDLSVSIFDINELYIHAGSFDIKGQSIYSNYLNEKLLAVLLTPSEILTEAYKLQSINLQNLISVLANNQNFNRYIINDIDDKRLRVITNRLLIDKENLNNTFTTQVEHLFKKIKLFFTLKNRCEEYSKASFSKYNRTISFHFEALENILLDNFEKDDLLQKINQNLIENEGCFKVQTKLDNVNSLLYELSCYPTDNKQVLDELDAEIKNLVDDKFDRILVPLDADASSSTLEINLVMERLEQIEKQVTQLIETSVCLMTIKMQTELLLKSNPLIHKLFFECGLGKADALLEQKSTSLNLVNLNGVLSQGSENAKKIIHAIDENVAKVKNINLTIKQLVGQLLLDLLSNKVNKITLNAFNEEIKAQVIRDVKIEDIKEKLNKLQLFSSDLVDEFNKRYASNLIDEPLSELIILQSKVIILNDRVQSKNNLFVRYYELKETLKKLALKSYVVNEIKTELIGELILRDIAETKVVSLLDSLNAFIEPFKKIRRDLAFIKVLSTKNYRQTQVCINLLLEQPDFNYKKIEALTCYLQQYLNINQYLYMQLKGPYPKTFFDSILFQNIDKLMDFQQVFQLFEQQDDDLFAVYRDANSMYQKRVDIKISLTSLMKNFKVNDNDEALIKYIHSIDKQLNSSQLTFENLTDLQANLVALEGRLNSQSYKKLVDSIENEDEKTINELKQSLAKVSPFERHIKQLENGKLVSERTKVASPISPMAFWTSVSGSPRCSAKSLVSSPVDDNSVQITTSNSPV